MKKYIGCFFIILASLDCFSQKKKIFYFKDEFGMCKVSFLSVSKMEYRRYSDFKTSFTAKYKLLHNEVKITKVIKGDKVLNNIYMKFSTNKDTLYIKNTQTDSYTMKLLSHNDR